MRSRRNEPVCFAKVSTGNELSLSGTAVVQLLKAVMERGKSFKFKASGWSMSPFIRDGDILTLSPPPIRFPRKGDVVSIIDPGTEKLVVHRVVGMKNHRYRIKGDNAAKKDTGSFGLNHICGHVTRVERNGKPVRFGLGPERRAIALLSQVPFMMKLVAKTFGLFKRIEAINHRPLRLRHRGRRE